MHLLQARFILAIGCLLLLNACSSGGNYTTPPPVGFSAPSGNIITLNIHNGTMNDNVSSINAHANNSIQCISILNNIGSIPISSNDAVTASGFNASTSAQSLTTDIYIMAYELSQAQWNTIVTTSGAGSQYLNPWLAIDSVSDFGTAANAMPAWGLSKDMIDTVLSAYNATQHFQLRLPTDIEWEYACRAAASTATRFSWGNDLDGAANFAHLAETNATAPRTVDAGSANALNLYNMHGNVWEWTSDDNLRGGSWSDSVISASSGNRMTMNTHLAYALAGLRLIVEAP